MAALVKNQSTEVTAQEETCPVPDEMLGRLYRANEARVADLVASLSPRQRANLATFCYRRGHLRELGLMIARTCELPALVDAAGTAGSVMYDQSHQHAFAATTERRPTPGRARITLATRTTH